MATTTPNFGWSVPTSTDLVKDGATAIELLGDSIDTTLVDLKGGTTGQVLSKTSNTDMDFTWVTTDDTNAIQNAIVDAKGDLIGASAADTPARLAVGANGTVLTADSAETTGLKWATPSSNSFTSLASGSLSSNILTLGSISSAYKDLRVIVKNVQVASVADIIVNVNSSTTLDYLTLRAANTTAGNEAVNNVSDFYLNNNQLATGSNSNIIILEFPNYAETTGFKVINYRARFSANSQVQQFSGGAVVRDTSAVSEIVIKTGGPNFAGGTYEIWGIK